MIRVFNRCIDLTASHYVKPEDEQEFKRIIKDFYINEDVLDNENYV